MKTEIVSIIGLDRVSGSIGLALGATDLGLTIVGHDKDRSAGTKAKEIGAIDRIATNPVSAAAEADILIVNVPLSEQEKMLELIGQDIKEHVLIVDLSALKGPGQKWANKYVRQGHYVGASPVLVARSLMDGRSDIEAASPELFQRSVFCLMPSPTADPKAVETAVNLGRLLGAAPFFLDGDEFDSLMQGVGTTPGLLSAALFRAVTKSSGWRDMLRFAGTPFALATSSLDTADLAELAFHNKEASLHWLDVVLAELQEVRRWIAEGDVERVSLILEELSLERARWLHEREENEWLEIESPDLSGMSFRSQMFGFRPKKREDKK